MMLREACLELLDGSLVCSGLQFAHALFGTPRASPEDLPTDCSKPPSEGRSDEAAMPVIDGGGGRIQRAAQAPSGSADTVNPHPFEMLGKSASKPGATEGKTPRVVAGPSTSAPARISACPARNLMGRSALMPPRIVVDSTSLRTSNQPSDDRFLQASTES